MGQVAAQHLRRISPGGDQGEVEPIANTLRRNGYTYDLFAELVAAELNLLEATRGDRSTSLHMSNRLEAARNSAREKMLRRLDTMEEARLPADTLLMPLMQLEQRLLLCKGVLVCLPDQDEALYVLQLQGMDPGKKLGDYAGVDFVSVTKPAADKPEGLASLLS